MDFGNFLAIGALNKLNDERSDNIRKESKLREENENLKQEISDKDALQQVKDRFTDEQLQEASDLTKSYRMKNMRDQYKMQQLKNSVAFYEDLLESDFATIANNNNEFKKNLMDRIDHLGLWMASQKGFKDVAIQFGLKMGYSRDQVLDLAEQRGIEILDNDALKESSQANNELSLYNTERVRRIKEELVRPSKRVQK